MLRGKVEKVEEKRRREEVVRFCFDILVIIFIFRLGGELVVEYGFGFI